MDLFVEKFEEKNIPIPSVGELTQKIKQLLEGHFSQVQVKGELSNVKRSSNGHIYCTLKDSEAQLPCVIWRTNAQSYHSVFEDGKEVILSGTLQLYKPQGRYQLIIEHAEPVGIGRLQLEFERLKKKLEAEGLFNPNNKKPLPRFPSTIGVVTSRTTAAFQDIISTLSKRWPLAEIELFHASVQGERAADEICTGIEYLANQNHVDVIIVTRGGGSLEDLWPFNEERVARAIFACSIPVISGVGHEIDFSISDFVADVRAATPTQAAVMATPNREDILVGLDDYSSRVSRVIEQKWSKSAQRVEYLAKSHALKKVLELWNISKMKHAQAHQTLHHRIEYLMQERSSQIQKWMHRLDKLNPNVALEQGYTRIWQNNLWIKSKSKLVEGEAIQVEFKDGRAAISNQK